MAAPGTLLFLDDVDPVHQECTGLVQRLLVALPDLRVLVTSRQVLGLGEEHVLALRPLATSSPSGATRPAAAVELFLHRARAVGRDSRRVTPTSGRWNGSAGPSKASRTPSNSPPSSCPGSHRTSWRSHWSDSSAGCTATARG
ncbi:hypothetical protein D3C59_31420 [Streptomyces sp. SHP22-7]|nr:hypothetical protein D3C59_31420 [Streptomyces sp. SHP22-7]